jgi:hypothetical protein
LNARKGDLVRVKGHPALGVFQVRFLLSQEVIAICWPADHDFPSNWIRLRKYELEVVSPLEALAQQGEDSWQS